MTFWNLVLLSVCQTIGLIEECLGKSTHFLDSVYFLRYGQSYSIVRFPLLIGPIILRKTLALCNKIHAEVTLRLKSRWFYMLKSSPYCSLLSCWYWSSWEFFGAGEITAPKIDLLINNGPSQETLWGSICKGIRWSTGYQAILRCHPAKEESWPTTIEEEEEWRNCCQHEC